MKNIYTWAIGLLLITAGMSSCTVTRERCNKLYPPAVIHSVDTVTTITETLVHDTTYLPADNSQLRITLEADSQNNVQIVSTSAKNGTRSNISMRTARNNRVLHAIFDCHCDSQNIYHVFRDRDTSVYIRDTEVKIHQVEVPAKFTWWQQTKNTFGGYALGLDLAVLLIILGYLAWKIFKVVTPQGMAISAGTGALSWISKLFRR